MKRNELHKRNNRNMRNKGSARSRRYKKKSLIKKRISYIIILTIILFVSLKISYKYIIPGENNVLAKEINIALNGKNSSDKKDSKNREADNKNKESDSANKDLHNANKESDNEKNSTNKELDDEKNNDVQESDDEKSNESKNVSNNETLNKSYVDDVSLVIPETLYKWNFYREDNKKIAYLTFDDGPSEESTEKILDILLKNNVKATFFTLGTSIDNNEKSVDLLKRMRKEGHSIGTHGYSHDYKILYPNETVDVPAFMNDVEKGQEKLKEALGDDFYTRLVRMPGGHSSWYGTSELDKALEEKGLYQMDWNALNGDAEGKEYSREELLNNLKDTVGDQDVIIVLMHDTDAKKKTVEYLQSAIDYLKETGFEFRTLE